MVLRTEHVRGDFGTLVGVAVLFNGVTRAVISGRIGHDARAFSAAAA